MARALGNASNATSAPCARVLNTILAPVPKAFIYQYYTSIHCSIGLADARGVARGRKHQHAEPSTASTVDMPITYTLTMHQGDYA